VLYLKYGEEKSNCFGRDFGLWWSLLVEKITIENKNIFPNAERLYETKIGQTWMFGRYNVGLTASYGDTDKTLIANSFVWVIPITLISIIIFSILIIILIAYLISTKIKAKQVVLEEKLEEEISDLEAIKNKFKDKLPK